MWYISAFIVVFWTDLRTRIIASFLALLHSFNLTILRLCLPVLHCVKVSKPIVGLLNAHNCMGSCMLVKLLPPRVIHHCRVHNWVQAQVVSFASKCFQAWLHYFYYVRLRENSSAARAQCKVPEHIIYIIHITVWPLVMFSVSNILYLYILYMLYYFLTFTGTFSRCTMRGCRSRPILVYNCILRSNSLLQYNEIHSLFVICSLHSVLQTMRSWIQFNLDFCVTRAQLL